MKVEVKVRRLWALRLAARFKLGPRWADRILTNVVRADVYVDGARISRFNGREILNNETYLTKLHVGD